MNRKPVGFAWTQARADAAIDVAADELTDEAIAAKAGVARPTLWAWKQRDEFKARVEEHRDAMAVAVRRHGIAVLENRVRALGDRWRRMRQVIEARAADPAMAAVPGGTTGLLVRQVKMIGLGAAAEKVEEFAVDVGLLKELREHERQAAQELGQWTERHRVDDARKEYDVTNSPADL